MEPATDFKYEDSIIAAHEAFDLWKLTHDRNHLLQGMRFLICHSAFILPKDLDVNESISRKRKSFGEVVKAFMMVALNDLIEIREISTSEVFYLDTVEEFTAYIEKVLSEKTNETPAPEKI